jgi:acyl-CoA dehydrogenase
MMDGTTINQHDGPVMPLGEAWPEIRESVAKICERFDNAYWMRLDDESAYPDEFVKALTDAGYLAVLIPEEFGGSGLPISAAGAVLETIHRTGCNAAACHAQMYTMGTVLRHGTDEQKQKYLPHIATGELRLQAFGVTEPTTGSDTTQLKTRAVRDGNQYVVNGQKVWTSRALQSDLMLLLARTTPADEVKRRSDGISVFLVDLREARGNGLDIRKLDAAINHNTCEVFIDNLKLAPDTLVGEEGRGFRYILDGMNAERILIAYESIGDAKASSSRSRAPGPNCRPPSSWSTRPPPSSSRASTAAPKPTPPRCSPPKPPGKRARPACRPTAASPSPRNTASSANGANAASTRSPPSPRT